ncbi:MAG: sodium-dependent transporter [Methanobacteriaceae archaeon]|nr:sodium-dependent transporter [Methanobacteriaceae archaeon]
MGERVEWKSNLTFLLAMVGAAVGLGNIWRFPYIFYSNGQGSFLIPYLCAILILGLPFLLLEYSLGAKFNDSVLNTFARVDKKFKLVAWAIMIISFLIVTYYLTIVGWDFNYFFLSFTKAWGSNPDMYFNVNLLHSTNDLSGITTFVPYISIAVLVLWVLVWLISHRGIKGIGNFTSIFVPLLFILGIGIAIYDVTLPGASIGLVKFLQPDWSLLTSADIWLAAFGQILFTLSIGITVVLSYSSHLPKEINLTRNACTVILANCGFELINAVGVFSILGHMSYKTGLSFDQLITSGSGLAFVVFPQVFNILGPVGTILGILFFFSILIAGLTTAISYIEPMVDSFESAFKLSRNQAVTILCIAGFLVSLIFTTTSGNLLVTLFDDFLNNFALMIAIVLQCIIFAHIYGTEDLKEVLNRNTWFHVGKWWDVIIKYILPIIIIVLWVFGVYGLIMSGNSEKLLVYAIIAIVIIVLPFIFNFIDNKVNKVSE